MQLHCNDILIELRRRVDSPANSWWAKKERTARKGRPGVVSAEVEGFEPPRVTSEAAWKAHPLVPLLPSKGSAIDRSATPPQAGADPKGSASSFWVRIDAPCVL